MLSTILATLLCFYGMLRLQKYTLTHSFAMDAADPVICGESVACISKLFSVSPSSSGKQLSGFYICNDHVNKSFSKKFVSSPTI